MRSEQLIELEYPALIRGGNLPHLPMGIAYEAVQLEEMRTIDPIVQGRDRRRFGTRARNDASGPSQVRMNHIRNEFLNLPLDRPLSTQPSRHFGYAHPARNCVENGRAETAPMETPHDQQDLVLGSLKARQFRGIAFGAGEAAGQDDVHYAHGWLL